MKQQLNIKRLITGAAATLIGLISVGSSILASANNASAFGLSPMYKVLVLNPGETYRDSIKIVNRDTDSTSDFYYKIGITPFDMEGAGNLFDRSSDHTIMTNWITITSDKSGVVPYGKDENIEYEINVPENAPAGGQYAAIMVGEDKSASNGNEAFGVQESMQISYLIYAEVTGETVKQGDILSTSVPNFVLSGPIKGTSEIKNTGNVHGTAKYSLKVFPLFSNEEVYTNEEDPDTFVILPDRTYYNESAWQNTPMVGIFNVVYSVDFEGVTSEVSKMVIVCPIWLLFIIIFAIFALIFYFIAKSKARKKASQKTSRS